MDALRNKLEYANKKTRFAWAKYYAQVNEDLATAHEVFMKYNSIADDKAIPEHVKTTIKEMAAALKKKWECPICLDMIADEHLEITNCGHYYCKECVESWKKTCKDRGDEKWFCAVCKRAHKFHD